MMFETQMCYYNYNYNENNVMLETSCKIKEFICMEFQWHFEQSKSMEIVNN